MMAITTRASIRMMKTRRVNNRVDVAMRKQRDATATADAVHNSFME